MTSHDDDNSLISDRRDFIAAEAKAELMREERLAELNRATVVQDCRSEEGVTVGLVDAIISILRVLAPRDLSAKNVQEALADLSEDPDFRTVRTALATRVALGERREGGGDGG